MTTTVPILGSGRQVPVDALLRQLMLADFSVFLAQLLGVDGQPLELAVHLLAWARHLVDHPRLVLRAPRSHGKSTLVLAFILWRLWCHGRDAGGRLAGGVPAPFQVLLFSATKPLAEAHLATLRDLLEANQALFTELVPERRSRRSPTAWSASRVRLTNGGEVVVRGYSTPSRGLHPALLVLDDVLSDQNCRTSDQRSRSWRYLLATLLPMHPARVVVIGTPFHQSDLLGQLARPGEGGALGFAAHAYRAFDEDAGLTLWPTRFTPAEFVALRDQDPAGFSREFQCEPRDEAASMFPIALTGLALDRGAALTFVPGYRPTAGEYVVIGIDPAISGSEHADYTVALVVAYDRVTRDRRVLAVWRERGLGLNDQVRLARELAAMYGARLLVIEDNGFQRYIIDALHDCPELFGRLLPHTTGARRASLDEGIPALKLELIEGRWIMPCGDAASRHLARTWQGELGSFGWQDGHLRGTDDHDDLVLASWFVEVGIRLLVNLDRRPPREEIITGEDLGIRRYQVSPEWDAEEARLGPFRVEEDELEMIERILRWRAEHRDD
jgi:hypothetical protein